jgi:SH3-like domain-containing protein
MNRRALLAVAAALALWAALHLPGRARVASSADALGAGAADEAVALLEAPAPLPLGPDALYALSHALRAQGEPLRALAALRAAWELAPRDADVQHDLAWQRAQLAASEAPVGPARPWMMVFAASELAVLALALTAAASAAAVAARAARAPWSAVASIAALATLADGVALTSWSASIDQPVVVVGQEAVARAGPAFGDSERHVLGPGAEVRVRRETGAFVLVEDGEGRRGWVVRDTLLFPPR